MKHDAPVDDLGPCQPHGAAHLGEGSEQQVGADGQVRLDPKEKDQNGHHQRAATDAGQPDDQAHKKPGKDKREVSTYA